MGLRGSTLIGKAQPDERLMRFTSHDITHIFEVQKRHVHDLGSAFALGPKQVSNR